MQAAEFSFAETGGENQEGRQSHLQNLLSRFYMNIFPFIYLSCFVPIKFFHIRKPPEYGMMNCSHLLTSAVVLPDR